MVGSVGTSENCISYQVLLDLIQLNSFYHCYNWRNLMLLDRMAWTHFLRKISLLLKIHSKLIFFFFNMTEHLSLSGIPTPITQAYKIG